MKCISFLIVLLILFGACDNPQKEKESLIQQEITLTVKNYQTRRRAECMANVYDKANKMADSIIMARANLTVDSAVLIKKPDKPIKPAFKNPLDSTPVVPLIK